MEIIGKLHEEVTSFGVVLEASASELTQGPMGWNFEQYAAKYFGKY